MKFPSGRSGPGPSLFMDVGFFQGSRLRKECSKKGDARLANKREPDSDTFDLAKRKRENYSSTLQKYRVGEFLYNVPAGSACRARQIPARIRLTCLNEDVPGTLESPGATTPLLLRTQEPRVESSHALTHTQLSSWSLEGT